MLRLFTKASTSCLHNPFAVRTTQNIFHTRLYTTDIATLVSNITKLAKNVVEAPNTSQLNDSYQLFQNDFEKLLKTGKHNEYLEEFTKNCNRSESVYQGYLCRGYALLRLAKYEDARHDFLTLQLLDNVSMRKAGGTGITNERILLLAYHLLFNLFMATGKTHGKDVDTCISGLRELNPDFAKGCLDVAFYYRIMGDNTVAKKHYDKAFELSPESEDVLLARANFKHTTGDSAGALQDYKLALSINPESIEAKKFVTELQISV